MSDNNKIVAMPAKGTGLAACNISGVTLHSFDGIGTGKGDLAATLGLDSESVLRSP